MRVRPRTTKPQPTGPHACRRFRLSFPFYLLDDDLLFLSRRQKRQRLKERISLINLPLAAHFLPAAMDRIAVAPAPHRAFGLASLIHPLRDGPALDPPESHALVDQVKETFMSTAALATKRCE